MNKRQLDYYFRYARRLFANLPKRAYLTLLGGHGPQVVSVQR